MKLLLVEDDPGVREGLVDLLEEIAPVQVASTVESALVLLEEQPFGLVFADLNIGRSAGGVTVACAASAKELPVIICTGASRREAEAMLGEVKVDAIVTKPFLIDDVLAIARRLMRR